MSARIRAIVHLAGIVACLVAGTARAQMIGGSDLSGAVSGPGIVPLGAMEGEVLEHVSVGIPIAPGISVGEKFAYDRNSADATLNKSGITIALPYGDVTIGMSGEVSFNGTGPGVADIPNYLVPALLPPGLARLVMPFKISGGTTPGPGSVSLGQKGGMR